MEAFRPAQEVLTPADTLPQGPGRDSRTTWASRRRILATRGREERRRAEPGRGGGASCSVLEVHTRAALPQGWAATQNSLGLALRGLAARQEGAEAARSLAEAVGAFRSAQEVYSRATLPEGWAMTQNNLGAALQGLAARQEGADAARSLAEAVVSYRSALEVYTRATLPHGWALTQNPPGRCRCRAGGAGGADAAELVSGGRVPLGGWRSTPARRRARAGP